MLEISINTPYFLGFETRINDEKIVIETINDFQNFIQNSNVSSMHIENDLKETKYVFYSRRYKCDFCIRFSNSQPCLDKYRDLRNLMDSYGAKKDSIMRVAPNPKPDINYPRDLSNINNKPNKPNKTEKRKNSKIQYKKNIPGVGKVCVTKGGRRFFNLKNAIVLLGLTATIAICGSAEGIADLIYSQWEDQQVSYTEDYNNRKDELLEQYGQLTHDDPSDIIDSVRYRR